MMASRGLNPEPQRMTVLDGFIWAVVGTIIFVLLWAFWNIGHVALRSGDCKQACGADYASVGFTLPWADTECHCWPAESVRSRVVTLEDR